MALQRVVFERTIANALSGPFYGASVVAAFRRRRSSQVSPHLRGRYRSAVLLDYGPDVRAEHDQGELSPCQILLIYDCFDRK
jgi:hypothetical protein